MINYFVLHFDSKPIFDALTDEEAGQMVKAFFEYTTTGKEPELNRTLSLLFMSFKHQFERDVENYHKKVERLRENGKKGGAPKGNQNAKKENNQMVEKTTKTSQEKEEEKEKEKEEENYRLIFERLNNISNAHARLFISTFLENIDNQTEVARQLYGDDVAEEYQKTLPLLVELCIEEDFAEALADADDMFVIRSAQAFAGGKIKDKKAYLKKACKN